MDYNCVIKVFLLFLELQIVFMCREQVMNMPNIFSFPLYKPALYVENDVQVNICVSLPSVLSAPAKVDE